MLSKSLHASIMSAMLRISLVKVCFCCTNDDTTQEPLIRVELKNTTSIEHILHGILCPSEETIEYILIHDLINICMNNIVQYIALTNKTIEIATTTILFTFFNQDMIVLKICYQQLYLTMIKASHGKYLVTNYRRILFTIFAIKHQ